MKKTLLVLFSLLPVLFFSCASKDQVVDEAAQALEEQQAEAPSEVLEQADNTAAPVVTSAETPEETAQTQDLSASENADDADSDVLLINELVNQELEEIIEPEVIELEPPEEPVKQPEPVAEEVTKEEAEMLEAADAKADEAAENEGAPADGVAEGPTVTDETTVADETTVISAGDEDEVISVDGDDDSPAENESEKADEPVIEPSRSVTLKRMEYLEVNYPGNGWIYMGITDGSKDLTNLGRKVGTQNTTFTLQAKNAGTKILHFYKNDAVTNTFIDDYLEVIVLDEKGSNKNHVKAPVYKVPVPKKPVKPEPVVESTEQTEAIPEVKPAAAPKPAETAKPAVAPKAEPVKEEPKKEEPVKAEPPKREPVKTEPAKKSAPAPKVQDDDEVEFLEQPAEETSTVEVINSDDLLKEIKGLYNSKDYAAALDKLKIFFESATKKVDEALYIQGQIYETKSAVQNINAAIDSYTTLTKNYPASKYWDDANKRIIYLKRFYLEGR